MTVSVTEIAGRPSSVCANEPMNCPPLPLTTMPGSGVYELSGVANGTAKLTGCIETLDQSQSMPPLGQNADGRNVSSGVPSRTEVMAARPERISAIVGG